MTLGLEETAGTSAGLGTLQAKKKAQPLGGCAKFPPKEEVLEEYAPAPVKMPNAIILCLNIRLIASDFCCYAVYFSAIRLAEKYI